MPFTSFLKQMALGYQLELLYTEMTGILPPPSTATETQRDSACVPVASYLDKMGLVIPTLGWVIDRGGRLISVCWTNNEPEAGQNKMNPHKQ